MFNTWFISILGALLSLIAFSVSAPSESKHLDALPASLKSFQCHESDPNLKDCLIKGLQYGIKQFKTGISDVGLPVLDPTEIKKVTYNFDNDLIKGKVQLRNVTIKGLSDIKLTMVDLKRNGNAVTMINEGVIPKLTVHGRHRAEVFFNNAKISSEGSFDVTLTNVAFKVVLDDELYEKDGHMYVRTKHIEVEPTVDDMKLRADGIFEDAALNDAIVEFINKNWRDFYKLLVTEARSTWEPTILKAANNFHTYVPYDLLIVKD